MACRGAELWALATEFEIGDEFLPTSGAREASCEVVEPYERPSGLFDYQVELVDKLSAFLARRTAVHVSYSFQRVRGKLVLRWRRSRDICVSWTPVLGKAPLYGWHIQRNFAIKLLRRSSEWAATGTRAVKLARFWGTYGPSVDEMRFGFVVAGYQKLLQFAEAGGDDFQRFKQSVQVVLVDEAHKALATTVKRFLDTVKGPRTKIVGLTATPGRGQHDSVENRRLAALFDRRLIVAETLGIDPVSRLQERGILARVDRVTIESGVRFARGSAGEELDDVPPRLLSRLAKNSVRNDVIVDAVADQVSVRRASSDWFFAAAWSMLAHLQYSRPAVEYVQRT